MPQKKHVNYLHLPPHLGCNLHKKQQNFVKLHGIACSRNQTNTYAEWKAELTALVYPPLIDQRDFAVESSCVCYYMLAGKITQS